MFVCLSVRPSVRMERLGSHWPDFHDISYLSFFSKICWENRVSLKSDKNNEHFTWRPIYFLITSGSVLLKMRNVSDKICRKKSKQILCAITFLFLENRVFYEITWKSILEPGRPQMTTWCMRIACWVPQATTAHSEYVILKVYPLKQWLHECASA